MLGSHFRFKKMVKLYSILLSMLFCSGWQEYTIYQNRMELVTSACANTSHSGQGPVTVWERLFWKDISKWKISKCWTCFLFAADWIHKSDIFILWQKVLPSDRDWAHSFEYCHHFGDFKETVIWFYFPSGIRDDT